MPGHRSLWTTVSLPAIISGGTVAGCAYFTIGGLLVPACILAATLLTIAVTGLVVLLQQQDAGAQLRRAELRGQRGTGTGLYHKVVEEAVEIVERADLQARDAILAVTRAEAKEHVQKGLIRNFQSALELLEDAVFLTSADGAIRHANPAAHLFLEVLGSRPGEDDTADLLAVPELHALLTGCRTQKSAAHRRSVQFEIEACGHKRVHRAVARRIENEDGTVGAIVLVISDVSAEHLAQTRHAEFVSSVAHELKTPMASIKAFVELLLDGDVASVEEQRELYGFIDMQVDRLTRLVNDMLNMARIESGVITVERLDVELNDTLQKALEVVQPLAEDKGITLASELSDLYLAVHVDTDLFTRAIINLLSNAVKYTPAGGQVRLRSRMDEGFAVIEIKDTGMGIPEESLPHIFDRFYRVPENNRAAAGTGLGLSLVHYIITDIHSGSIEVDSVVDEGSTFTIRVALGHQEKSHRRCELAGNLA
jgi:two-component system phosphate regulon sensor histidine kinase PhoR